MRLTSGPPEYRVNRDWRIKLGGAEEITKPLDYRAKLGGSAPEINQEASVL